MSEAHMDVIFWWIIVGGCCSMAYEYSQFNSSPPEQNGRYFADDIFKSIFLKENARISIKILGQLWPSGVFVACVCLCHGVSVRASTLRLSER